MRTRMLFAAGLFSLVLLPLSLAAQEAPPAQKGQGIWIEVGSGLGYAQLDCSGCGAMPNGAPWRSGAGAALYAAAGVTPLPNLLVGGEVNAYFRWSDAGPPQPRPGVNDRDAYLGHAAVTARFYPLAGTPLFIKAGAGVGGYRLEEINRYTTSSWGSGIFLPEPSSRTHSDLRKLQTLAGALQAGMGYEVVVRQDIAFVPNLNVVQLFTENVQREFRGEMVTGPRNPRYVQLGLAVRLYPERLSYADRRSIE